MDKIAHEEGNWVDAPEDELVILRSAIFEALFSYVSIATEDADLLAQSDMEISPEKIINAMMRRTELELIDALVKSYHKRRTHYDKD
tara:strand:+ start:2257 stop:2517 length:261 start_codon:yes stop_codon:yes gene_type:complete